MKTISFYLRLVLLFGFIVSVTMTSLGIIVCINSDIALDPVSVGILFILHGITVLFAVAMTYIYGSKYVNIMTGNLARMDSATASLRIIHDQLRPYIYNTEETVSKEDMHKVVTMAVDTEEIALSVIEHVLDRKH